MNPFRTSDGMKAVTAAAVLLGICTAGAAQRRLPFECGFESVAWFEAWGLNAPPRNTDLVKDDPARKFVTHRGKALRIKVAKDQEVLSVHVSAHSENSRSAAILWKGLLRPGYGQ